MERWKSNFQEWTGGVPLMELHSVEFHKDVHSGILRGVGQVVAIACIRGCISVRFCGSISNRPCRHSYIPVICTQVAVPKYNGKCFKEAIDTCKEVKWKVLIAHCHANYPIGWPSREGPV